MRVREAVGELRQIASLAVIEIQNRRHRDVDTGGRGRFLSGLIVVDAERCRVRVHTGVRHESRSEHHQIVGVRIAVIALGVDAVEHGIACCVVLGDLGDLGFDEAHVAVLANAPQAVQRSFTYLGTRRMLIR